MGHISKRVTAHTTRYYWYPGEKKDWLRAATALAAGFVGYLTVMILARDPLAATATGTALTTALAGFQLGKRDSRALAELPDTVARPDLTVRAARRAARAHSARGAWRGTVEGAGTVLAGLLVASRPESGILADWILPLVPGVVGALGHQTGMLADRMTHNSAKAAERRQRSSDPALSVTANPVS